MNAIGNNPELYLLGLTFLSFFFLIMGYLTKHRIYNLLSIPSFLAIALLIDTAPIYITIVGLSIWQVYYAFVSD